MGTARSWPWCCSFFLATPSVPPNQISFTPTPVIGSLSTLRTSKWRGLKFAFRFDARQPTSLLYKKIADGFELEGAIYTAPKRVDENRLNKRILLSVAQWHTHVNICLPPKRDAKTADWKKFGPNGSILTESECNAMDGRWMPDSSVG